MSNCGADFDLKEYILKVISPDSLEEIVEPLGWKQESISGEVYKRCRRYCGEFKLKPPLRDWNSRLVEALNIQLSEERDDAFTWLELAIYCGRTRNGFPIRTCTGALRDREGDALSRVNRAIRELRLLCQGRHRAKTTSQLQRSIVRRIKLTG